MSRVMYLIEFRNPLVQPTWAVIDTFAFCLNHTSPAAVSILMCMGGEPYSSSDNHSIINLVLGYCYQHCEMTESDLTAWTIVPTTVLINKAKATIISDLATFNGSNFEPIEVKERKG